MSSPELSFEIFPDNTLAGIKKLHAMRTRRAPFSPLVISVTFGAGGSMQQVILTLATDMARDSMDAVPHLFCMGRSRAKIRAFLSHDRTTGIRRLIALIALRGDIPAAMGNVQDADAFCFLLYGRTH